MENLDEIIQDIFLNSYDNEIAETYVIELLGMEKEYD